MEHHKEELCSCGIHPESVSAVRASMPPEETVFDVSELFRVFGDSTRARILCALSISELCVCDLAELLQMGQPAVSHHLRILRGAKIVKNRRSGKSIYYSMADDHIRDLFHIAFDHVREEGCR